MPYLPDTALARRMIRTSRLIALAVMVAASLVLCGWAFEISTLKSLVPGLTTMKANAAAAFVLSGMVLRWSVPHAGRASPRPTAMLARCLAAVVIAIGLLTLGEYGFGRDLGIDQWLFNDAGPLSGAQFPGRMAPITAINFILLATALLMLDISTRSGRRPSNWLALAIAVNSFLAILGYLYGVDTLYRIAALTSVALPTAILFVLLSLGLVCARPETRFVGTITSDSPAGLILRRLLPAAILIPPFAGWLRWQGELAGYYSTAFGLALFAISNVAIFTILIWLSARALQRIHEQRSAAVQVSDWQQAILNSADFTVISTDTQGVIRTINAGAANKLGYTADELVDTQTPAIIHDPAEVAARAQALSLELGRIVEPGFDTFVAKARRGSSDEHDWSYVRKDGSRFPVRLSVTPLTDANGTLTGFLGIGKDISAQKRAEAALRDSEQRLRLITDNLPALVAYIDPQQRYGFANAMYQTVFGVDPASMIGLTVREVAGGAIYAGLAEDVARALRGERVTAEGRILGQGREYFYRTMYVPDVAPDGAVRGSYAMTFDITDLKLGKLRLAASEARLRLITDNLPVFISYVDREHRFRFNNAAYARLLDQPLDQIEGRSVDDVFGTETYELVRPYLAEALTGVTVSFEFALPTGHVYGGTYIPDFNDANEVIGVYGLANDITEQKEVETKLRQLAQFDSLTGLANRSRFEDKLAEAIARSERSGQVLALVFLDLDHFKSINDNFGHHGGDLALQEFGNRLSRSVRVTDTVARLAGDEFVVILELLKNANESGKVAAKIVTTMQTPFRIADVQCEISTSMGIAVRRPGEIDGEALLRRADAALYRAKAAGRGCFIVEE